MFVGLKCVSRRQYARPECNYGNKIKRGVIFLHVALKLLLPSLVDYCFCSGNDHKLDELYDALSA